MMYLCIKNKTKMKQTYIFKHRSELIGHIIALADEISVTADSYSFQGTLIRVFCEHPDMNGARRIGYDVENVTNGHPEILDKRNFKLVGAEDEAFFFTLLQELASAVVSGSLMSVKKKLDKYNAPQMEVTRQRNTSIILPSARREEFNEGLQKLIFDHLAVGDKVLVNSSKEPATVTSVVELSDGGRTIFFESEGQRIAIISHKELRV